MTGRLVCRTLTAGFLTWGLAVIAPPSARAQITTILPDGGMITLVGCFQPGGKHHSKYVLAKPTIGTVASVPDGNCSAALDEEAVELKDTAARDLDESMLGKVIEVTGRMEKIEGTVDADDLRELHVREFRPVPVVAPRAAEMPVIIEPVAPTPEVRPLPLPEERPVATSGTTPTPVALPDTASSLPLLGSLSFLSLVGALLLQHRRRLRGEE
jgi:hypothetical protein